MSEIVLHDYWRSSAAYRVRIALNLKGISYRSTSIDLIADEQVGEGYRGVNPQGLVPALDIDGLVLSQSLAIIDYLDSRNPDPRLIPTAPGQRAKVLAQALVIAADIHPLNNLRVQRYLTAEFGADRLAVGRWMQRWIAPGFAALEQQAPEQGFLGGDQPGLADVMLVPQMYNARRFQVALDDYPRLARIDAAATAIPAFAAAAPENIGAA